MNPFESEHHQVVRINGAEIRDEEEFHNVCSTALGFPGFYGCNMNAWIDCLTYLDDPASEMTTVHVENGTMLLLQIDNARELKNRNPKLLESIMECVAFVNWRRMEKGLEPVIALSCNA